MQTPVRVSGRVQVGDLLRPTVHDLRHIAASLPIPARANVKAAQRMKWQSQNLLPIPVVH